MSVYNIYQSRDNLSEELKLNNSRHVTEQICFFLLLSFSLRSPPSGQKRPDEWSAAVGPGADAASARADAWRPVVCPAEVTVTDVTINSLTVTFRESRVAKGFFRDWSPRDPAGGERATRGGLAEFGGVG